jgi:hypothetical protein
MPIRSDRVYNIANRSGHLIEPGCRDLSEADVAVIELKNAALIARPQPFAQSPRHQRLAIPCTQCSS